MKKFTSLLLALLMLAGMMAVPTMAAADEVSVYLFGEKLEFDVPAQIVNGRTLVPVRKIFEELGYKVDWDNDTRTAIAVSEERTIRITENSYTMYVNDETKTLDVPAQIIGGRTMVPARAISEASGYKVDWDGDTRSVLITNPGTSSEAPTTDNFSELRKIIMDKGTYDASEECYYMADRDAITLKYYPGNEQYKEEIIITYLQINSDGSKSYSAIALAKEGAPVGLFEYLFATGSISRLYGTFSEENGRFEPTENTFDPAIKTQAFNMYTSTIRYDLARGLKNLTGFELSDFGIAY